MDYPGRGKNAQHPHDHSVMSYSGHHVLQTLIRCYSPPQHRYSAGTPRMYATSGWYTTDWHTTDSYKSWAALHLLDGPSFFSLFLFFFLFFSFFSCFSPFEFPPPFHLQEVVVSLLCALPLLLVKLHEAVDEALPSAAGQRFMGLLHEASLKLHWAALRLTRAPTTPLFFFFTTTFVRCLHCSVLFFSCSTGQRIISSGSHDSPVFFFLTPHLYVVFTVLCCSSLAALGSATSTRAPTTAQCTFSIRYAPALHYSTVHSTVLLLVVDQYAFTIVDS